MSQPGQPGQDVPDEVRAAAEEAIKSFSFWNYGMDDVDPSSEYAEWVPALAASIAAAVAPVIDGLTAGLAAGLAVAADQIMARRCGQDAAFCAHCSCRSEDAAIIRGMS